MQLDIERYWLYAAVDPEADRLLHLDDETTAPAERPLGCSARSLSVMTRCFSLVENHGCRQPVVATAFGSNTKHTGIEPPPNVYLEK